MTIIAIVLKKNSYRKHSIILRANYQKVLPSLKAIVFGTIFLFPLECKSNIRFSIDSALFNMEMWIESNAPKYQYEKIDKYRK